LEDKIQPGQDRAGGVSPWSHTDSDLPRNQ
jgi:hypothetical protein